MKITFEKVTTEHKGTIFSWLDEPHVQEFWDNSQDHRDDIIDFMHGKNQKERLKYWDGIGILSYWIGLLDNVPYAFIMTHEEHKSIKHTSVEPADFLVPYLSETGRTFALDFFIGQKDVIGKGFGAKTLLTFMDYFKSKIEPETDAFVISPYLNNPRAIHVYQKAGFKKRSEFTVKDGYFKDSKGIVMVKV